MSLLDRLVAAALPVIPPSVVGHFSRRYIAGSSIEDAMGVIRDLNGRGLMATVDILGEHVDRLETAQQAAADYVTLLDRIDAEGVDANVSVKLTQIGLVIDPPACLDNMSRILSRAREHGNFVRIDMEDSSVTQATLDLFRTLRTEFDNVGVVIQAYLRRSAGDVKALATEGANLRLCKGIYVEPRSIAFRDPEIIRRSFSDLVEVLLRAGCYVGIATHDEVLVYDALRMIEELELRPDQYEFQMLLGVDEELRDLLIRAGHRLRVYVPYGAHWYAYSMRRLKENPRIAGHVFRDVVRRAVPGGARSPGSSPP